jgi:hypothetical protein
MIALGGDHAGMDEGLTFAGVHVEPVPPPPPPPVSLFESEPASPFVAAEASSALAPPSSAAVAVVFPAFAGTSPVKLIVHPTIKSAPPTRHAPSPIFADMIPFLRAAQFGCDMRSDEAMRVPSCAM